MIDYICAFVNRIFVKKRDKLYFGADFSAGRGAVLLFLLLFIGNNHNCNSKKKRKESSSFERRKEGGRCENN